MKIYFTTLLLSLVSPFWICAQELNEEKNASQSDAQIAVISTEVQLHELIAIFKDAIKAPTKYNAYVQPYLEMSGFPQKGEASKSEFDTMLTDWINSNSQEIEQLIIDRQKAHDELYGPR